MSRESFWDGLRALLLFLVLNEHIARMLHPVLLNSEVLIDSSGGIDVAFFFSPIQLLFNGAAAVSVMFCLTGYLISKSAFKSHNLLSFDVIILFIKRYLRICIPLLGATVITYIAIVTGVFEPQRLSPLFITTFGYEPFNLDVSFVDSIKQALFTTPFLMNRDNNPMLWVVSVELYASFALYLLCLITTNKWLKGNIQIMVSLSVCVVLICLNHHEISIAFVLGHTLAVLERFHLLRHRRLLLGISTIGLCGFLFVLKGGVQNPFNFVGAGVHQLDSQYIVYGWGGAGLMLMIMLSQRCQRYLSTKPLQLIGKASYSMLLVHFVALIIATKWGTYIAPHDVVLQYMFVSIVTYVGTFWLGTGLYLAIEKPVLKRLNRLPLGSNIKLVRTDLSSAHPTN
ncbi:acyltransferase family protein [Alteromonas stellipolaris]|uniref:acyltransferase family protein n=1 Tax=Alteromonas stellipolaris TaxID=233316 RepID=UPI001D28D2D3|nr:acyltransferase [Alteromonas stellipolaris]MBZ2163262.1 acyltransferase [Alteromonas stellipolaris]